MTLLPPGSIGARRRLAQRIGAVVDEGREGAEQEQGGLVDAERGVPSRERRRRGIAEHGSAADLAPLAPRLGSMITTEDKGFFGVSSSM